MGNSKKRIWDNFEQVAEVRKADNLKFVISASTRDGYRCVNIREWYKRQKDNVWKPGRDGMSFMLKVPLKDGSGMLEPAEELLTALRNAIAIASTMDLLDETKAVYIDKE